jgi:hypothetical protein
LMVSRDFSIYQVLDVSYNLHLALVSTNSSSLVCRDQFSHCACFIFASAFTQWLSLPDGLRVEQIMFGTLRSTRDNCTISKGCSRCYAFSRNFLWCKWLNISMINFRLFLGIAGENWRLVNWLVAKSRSLTRFPGWSCSTIS